MRGRPKHSYPVPPGAIRVSRLRLSPELNKRVQAYAQPRGISMEWAIVRLLESHTELPGVDKTGSTASAT